MNQPFDLCAAQGTHVTETNTSTSPPTHSRCRHRRRRAVIAGTASVYAGSVMAARLGLGCAICIWGLAFLASWARTRGSSAPGPLYSMRPTLTCQLIFECASPHINGRSQRKTHDIHHTPPSRTPPRMHHHEERCNRTCKAATIAVRPSKSGILDP
jgi:hypothetical protein